MPPNLSPAGNSTTITSRSLDFHNTDNKIIWLIFIFIVFGFIVLNFKTNQLNNLIPVSSVNLGGLIYILALQPLLSKKIPILNLIFAILFPIAIVLLTGSLSSPFYFMLYIIPILTMGSYIPPIIVSVIEIILFIIGVVVLQNNLTIFSSNMFTNSVMIFSPFIAGIFGQFFPKSAALSPSLKQSDDSSLKTVDLKNANQQLESILQTMHEGILTTDLKGKIIFVNKKSCEILFANSNELLGKDMSAVLSFQDVNGKLLKNVQIKTMTSIGKQVSLVINTFPLVYDSKVQGTIYLLTDVTASAELEKLKLDFVAQAAHQLRTPLTILKSYLFVLSDSISGKLTADEKTDLERAVIGANQLTTLVENLLNISHIEEGKLPLRIVPSSLEPVLQSAIQKVSTHALQKTVKIVINRPLFQIPQVLIDSNLIEQVMVNLISNAIDFSSPHEEISLNFAIHQNFLITSITDHGPGIPSDSTTHLFNKFFKVGGSLTQETKGMGIGLYTSKAIIESHKGLIWVDSMLGKGSTFSFSLPIAPNQAQPMAVPVTPSPFQTPTSSLATQAPPVQPASPPTPSFITQQLPPIPQTAAPQPSIFPTQLPATGHAPNPTPPLQHPTPQPAAAIHPLPQSPNMTQPIR